MKLHGIILLLVFPVYLFAQDTLRFESVLEMAVEHSPRLKDKELISEQGRLTLENVRSNWYPELMLNGKASYQSDVVSVEIDQPGFAFSFPEMPHEQFGVNLDVKQSIYDGGFSRQKTKYEEISSAVSLKKVEVDIHALKNTISDLYFSALLLQENRKNMEIALENLKAREKVLTSSVEHGVAEETDLKLIRVEILKLLQSLSEIDAGRNGLMGMMRIYTGAKPDSVSLLAAPNLEIAGDKEVSRTELEWFGLQTQMIEAGKELQTVKRMPKLFAFGQAGIGMPGYNMLNDQVDTYYMVGAGLQWNIWDWNVSAREKQILEKQQQVVANSKESFLIKINAGVENEMKKLEHLRSAIELDREMVGLRISITRNAASKLDNGLISATEYLQVLNEENLARIRMTTDRIKLSRARVAYNLLTGNL